MTALIPVHAAHNIRDGIVEYLTTSFALADTETSAALKEFFSDPEEGMFHGPYVRVRLPYAQARGWEDALGWLPPSFVPYHHQAEAFRRLSSAGQDPEPTIVITGTGSGKTESFLMPILNHAREARARGERGVKALILYPMNALANDQAGRLAKLIWDNSELRDVTAGIYTGESTGARTVMTRENLITDRTEIRRNPPDILLTNYKMLNELLLRPHDREIWQHSATSFRYLVLDEFHTYDGAQGTDVALLLRRLGLMLKKHQPEGFLTEEENAHALGRVTPVATSATLGAKGEDGPVLEFATTVFGSAFPPDAVVSETTLDVAQWRTEMEQKFGASDQSDEDRSMPSALVMEEIVDQLDAVQDSPDYVNHAMRVFCERVWGCEPEAGLDRIVANYAGHELTARILQHASSAVPLIQRAPDDETSLPYRVLGEDGLRLGEEKSISFVLHALTAVSAIRARAGAADAWGGKRLPGVEAHLWLRELSRIDRAITPSAEVAPFRWHDDGAVENTAFDRHEYLPACYCRSCGRSGWMVTLEPGTGTVVFDARKIRTDSMRNREHTRPLIDATPEHLRALAEGLPLSALRSVEDSSAVVWLDVESEQLTATDPSEATIDQGLAVPVLTHAGLEAGKAARDEQCPSCGERDSIRYVGSSLATLLSVALSNLFGMPGLDDSEKKTLVFTDSVQDAAHRAGFVQARSRTFALRTQVRDVLDNEPAALSDLPRELTKQAGKDHRLRYQLLPPEIADYPAFRGYWDPDFPGEPRHNVEQRLAFDLLLEFGQRADLARSLVLTGAATVAVDLPDGIVAAVVRKVQEKFEWPNLLQPNQDQLKSWVHGILEMIRVRGGIDHPWFDSYLKEDGNAYLLNRLQSRARGVPAFAKGVSPEFPRVGAVLSDAKKDYGASPAGSPRGRYARWTSKFLNASTHEAAQLVTLLLSELASVEFLSSTNTNTGATMYAIHPDTIAISVEEEPAVLECGVCHARTGLRRDVRELLVGAPCMTPSCQGTLVESLIADNYYRRLYESTTPRTVVAREHTGLLDKEARHVLEEAFRGEEGALRPDAPNVLVATPTLEMGIDIGDLSTVMLSSLPETVANYTQRVGRAGRLTGNSLAVVLARGRGATLPKINAPLSVIAGQVVPPSAFLSAVEILQRQLIAYLIDCLPAAAIGDTRTAHNAFESIASGPSLVQHLLELTEEELHERQEEFIATVSADTSPEILEGLRTWAGGLTAISMPQKLIDAREEWRNERREILQRVETLSEQVESFEHSADAGDDDIKAERRQIRASLRHERARRESHATEHWVAAMEKAGLLPNFRLLDDAVTLSVHVSKLDPQSFEFDTEAYEYSRGISSALHELALGSTFYAQGIAAVIDSVEMGRQAEDIEKWRVCPRCSYSEVDRGEAAHSCPTCDEPRFADIGAAVDVLQMRKVAAEVEQTRAAINDSSDERSKASFTTHLTYSVVEEGESWFTSDGFGATFMPRVDLRWINLGKGEGPERVFAGRAMSAPLFRVCEECGHIDSEAGSNSKWDHRPWCSRRHAVEETTVSFALGRTLRTQGVLLYLPERLSSYVDALAVPSIIAAIKLGFRRVLGGNPDHLAVDSVKVMGAEGPMDALLLSDSVPGGTGYLYQFSSPEAVHHLLKVTLGVLEGCACQHDNRLACPECLLPFAGPDIESVSRESAEVALRSILLEKRHPTRDESVEGSTWADISTTRPATEQGSALEIRFRHMLLSELSALNVNVRQSMSGGYNRWTFEMPGGVQWRMKEQYSAGYTIPDFYFEPSNRNTRPIAVYLDGVAYHISEDCNRFDSDTSKRRRLYDDGVLPFAITARDLDRFVNEDAELPLWQRAEAGLTLVRKSRMLSAAEQMLLTSSPFTLLLKLLDDPVNPNWDVMRHAASYLALSAPNAQRERESDSNALMVSLHEAQLKMRITIEENQPRTKYLLLDPAVAVPDPDVWNDFLNLANLFWLSEDFVEVNTRNTLLTAGLESPAEALVAAATDAWAEFREEFAGEDDVERAIDVLSRTHCAVADDVGAEISGVPTLLVWTDLKIVMVDENDEEATDALRVEGWTSFAAQDLRPDDIPAQLIEEAQR